MFRAFLADPRNLAGAPVPAREAVDNEGEVAQAQLYRMIGGGAGMSKPAEIVLAVAFVGFMIAVLYALLMG